MSLDQNILNIFDNNNVDDSAANDQAILIKINNPIKVARSQGPGGNLAASMFPSTTSNKVYSTVASEIKDALVAKNVDATVALVNPAGYVPADGSNVWSDVGIAVGTFGAFALIWHFFGHSVKLALAPRHHHAKAK